MIAWCNGAWVQEGEAALSALDRGFTLGDGLFETMLWCDGAVQRFSRHMARLADSARALQLPAPPPVSEIEARCRELVIRNSLQEARAAVRLSWSAGQGARGLLRPDQTQPVMVLTVAPSKKNETPVSLATTSIRRNETAPSARCKALSYIDPVMARQEALRGGADDALLLNTQGVVAGASAANIFALIDGQVRTPCVTDGALPGTTRAALLEAGFGIVETQITPADLARAEAIALTNALFPWRAVSALDGRDLPAPPPLWARLAEAARNAP